MNKQLKSIALEKLENIYYGAKPQLNYSSEYELLVAVILSAQCTDERVNIVTGELFKSYNTPTKMLTLTKEELSVLIKPCGLNNSKAEHILGASKAIVENHGGLVPSSYDELTKLPGVGRKTANVVYSVAFGGDAIAVDTHVFRVSNRIGLAKGKTPLETEKSLMKSIPKNKWSSAHHWLIYHGRRVCSARNPKCKECALLSVCDYAKKKGLL